MRFSFVSLNRSAARTGVRGLAAAIVCSAALPAFAADMPGNLPDYENVSSHERKKPLFAGSYMGLEACVSGNTGRSKGSGKKSSPRMDAAFGLFGGYNWQMGSNKKQSFGSTTFKESSTNHRLMFGASYAF
ncbi:hypothetical protein [Pannonibacter indicus]|uniref:hypothetical protein n=1 Tax=Pannonibacter indicus TaxID=466044 RepID=UPI00391DEEEE